MKGAHISKTSDNQRISYATLDELYRLLLLLFTYKLVAKLIITIINRQRTALIYRIGTLKRDILYSISLICI